MNTTRNAILALGLSILAAPPVFADGPPPPASVTLDRADSTSRFGVEGSYDFLANGSGVSAGRLEVHGQYVDQRSGVGGYLQMPFSFLSGDDGTGHSQEYTGIGDLEVGAIYAPRIPVTGLGAAFHIGVALPTGSTALGNVLANITGVLPRITDYDLIWPEGTSLRIGFSPTFNSRYVFARIDVGVDINFKAQEQNPLADDTTTSDIVTNNIFRLNAAIGVKAGPASLAFESTNLYMIPNSGDAGGGGFGASWINEGAVALRFRSHYVEPYAAVVFPLDHDSHQLLDAALTVGLDLRLRPDAH